MAVRGTSRGGEGAEAEAEAEASGAPASRGASGALTDALCGSTGVAATGDGGAEQATKIASSAEAARRQGARPDVILSE